MPSSITIPKDPVYPFTMDWEALRREGFRHIEKIGSAIWTDYNTHDPGITILEVLCYAITDLGYRVNTLAAEDLFALQDPQLLKAFHTAAEILPNAPVTALDIRKIVIDVEGVKNAWIERAKVTVGTDAAGEPLYRLNGVYHILVEPEEGRQGEKNTIIANIKKRLHSNRPLCEDFGEIRFLDKEPLNICTNIELESDADPVAVQAGILYAIENFLTPPVHFYTLEEAMNRYATFSITEEGISILTDSVLPEDLLLSLKTIQDQSVIGLETWNTQLTALIGPEYFNDYGQVIFDALKKTYDSDPVYQGPLLEHGFLLEEELSKAQLRRTVYKSDLFTVISKVPGIQKVLQLEIKKAEGEPDDIALQYGQWCIAFDCDCIPVLDAGGSTFRYTKGFGFYELDDNALWEVSSLLELLRAEHAKVIQTMLDLPIPQGQFIENLEEYTSIQMDFPRNYQIGTTYIASTETVERRAMAKQLRAYLVFYDQLLANYLAQLAEVREVFAVIPPVEKIPLYQQLVSIGVPHIEELIPDQEAYEKTLQSLTEGGKTRKDLRTNRILDHLLARFGEQFTDYVLKMYEINSPVQLSDADEGDFPEWISDKRNFLRLLPLIGSSRGTGFNYQAPALEDNAHFWNSGNVEGLKRRVCAQLGIDDWNRKTISCQPAFEWDVEQENKKGQKRYFVIVKSEDGDIVLIGTKRYANRENAEAAGEAFFNMSAQTDHYDITHDKNNNAFTGFWDTDDRTFETAVFLKKVENENAQNQLLKIKKLASGNCESDDFHIVEHLLLRPADAYYDLLMAGGEAQVYKAADPYSFRITVVVPDWVDRFRDLRRRYHFEQTLRSEMPAHIVPCIYYLNSEIMLDFETIYYHWLELKTNPETEPADLRQVTNALVNFLNDHRDMCKAEGGTGNPAPSCP